MDRARKKRLSNYDNSFRLAFEENFDDVQVFWNLCDEYENCEDILRGLRSSLSENVISNNGYNFILLNWDDLLYIGGYNE